jgi:hypothetical protein
MITAPQSLGRTVRALAFSLPAIAVTACMPQSPSPDGVSSRTPVTATYTPVISVSAPASSASSAQVSGDFIAVRNSAAASDRETAVREAHYAAFDRALTATAGNQAAGSVGRNFRRVFERDFAAFRARYFTPDTDFRCMAQQEGRHLCEVQGMLRRTALEADVRTAVRNTEQTLSNNVVFVLSVAENTDRRVAFLVDRLSGQFTQYGHRILTGAAANSAIGAGRVDYALGLYEVTFSSPLYDPYESRTNGSAMIRFRLTDPRTRTEVANIPVQVSATLSGPNPDALQQELVAELARRASGEIARKVNEAVITSQQERAANTAGRQRQTAGQTLYLLHLNGVTARDRDKIAAMRTVITEILPGAGTEVDSGQSDGTRLTLRVTSPRRVTPDDFVDALYRAQQGSGRFVAEHDGSNEFSLTF